MKTKSTCYSLTNFSFSNKGEALHTQSCYGYDFQNGKLVSGLGFSALMLPISTAVNAQTKAVNYAALKSGETFLKVFCYFKGTNFSAQAASIYDRRLLFLGSSGSIYELKPFIDYQSLMLDYESSVSFTALPVALNLRQNGEDIIILTNPADDMLVWACSTSYPQTLSLDFHLTSLCESGGIIYATTDGDEKTIFYTTTMDPLEIDATNSGTIELGDERGASKKVISFKDYVYVFREYGITRINRMPSGSFALTQLYTSPNKIYHNTVCVCGDKILFLTKNGLYSFNGINVSRIITGYDSLFNGVDNSNAIGACVGERYYFACKLGYSDITQTELNQTHNAFFAYNLITEEICLVRGIDVSAMQPFADFSVEKMVITLNGTNACTIAELTHDGKLLGSNINQEFTSNTIILDSEKRIAKVEIEASSGTTIDVVTDKATIHLTCGKSGYNCFAPYAKANSFKLVVSSAGSNQYVNRISVTTNEIV